MDAGAAASDKPEVRGRIITNAERLVCALGCVFPAKGGLGDSGVSGIHQCGVNRGDRGLGLGNYAGEGGPDWH